MSGIRNNLNAPILEGMKVRVQTVPGGFKVKNENIMALASWIGLLQNSRELWNVLKCYGTAPIILVFPGIPLKGEIF